MTWAAVRETMPDVKSIAFDGCHKIYLLLDDEQTEQMRTYGYGEGSSELHLVNPETRGEMYLKIKEWYEGSCPLRFVNAVVTNHANPNAGFIQLITQFEDDERDEE